MEIETIDMGILNVEPVKAVRMPREKFVELVEQAIDRNEYFHPVRDKVMPVARTMQTFPIDQWMNPERGCGCVVGEYLVAADLIERQAFASEYGDNLVQIRAIEDLLENEPNGAALFAFGSEVNELIAHYIRTETGGCRVEAVLIEDA